MTVELFDLVLLAVSAAFLVPVLLLVLQVLAALGRRVPPAMPQPGAVRPRVAVLVPAHDESSGIAASLATVLPQLEVGDRLLVVADNCSDATAAIAAAAGAEVIERHDSVRRGKGYALDFGVRWLEAAPPEVLIIVDADCAISPGSIARLAHLAVSTARPVQALCLMHAPPNAGLKTRIAEFAWIVKNQVRPLGCLRLGLPCQLMGTGMAFPWQLIRTAELASADLVEDLQLGLAFAAAGSEPLFCPDALVSSLFPVHPDGLAAQRTRWEHGHLAAIVGSGPRLLWQALRQRKPALCMMVLDLCIPPLAALTLALIAWFAATLVVFAAGGQAGALMLATAAVALLAWSVGTAWSRFGRHVLTFRELLGAPVYIGAKIPIYLRLLGKRQVEWVRTRRDDETR